MDLHPPSKQSSLLCNYVTEKLQPIVAQRVISYYRRPLTPFKITSTYIYIHDLYDNINPFMKSFITKNELHSVDHVIVITYKRVIDNLEVKKQEMSEPKQRKTSYINRKTDPTHHRHAKFENLNFMHLCLPSLVD